MFMAENINSVRPIAGTELKYLKYRNLLYVIYNGEWLFYFHHLKKHIEIINEM